MIRVAAVVWCGIVVGGSVAQGQQTPQAGQRPTPC